VQRPDRGRCTCRLEHLRGSALGFRDLTNYIARSLLEAGGFRRSYTPDCEEPRKPHIERRVPAVRHLAIHSIKIDSGELTKGAVAAADVSSYVTKRG